MFMGSRLWSLLLGTVVAGCLGACSPAQEAAQSLTPSAQNPAPLLPATVPATPVLSVTERPTVAQSTPSVPRRQNGTPTTVAATAILRPSPPSGSHGSESLVVEYGASGRREVALTFDAGADRGYGEEILDLLAQEGIKASFGMTGMYAAENPDLVRRMVDEGHMVFNHTWSHQSFTGANPGTAPLTRAERLEELRTTETLVRDLTGYDLRPYFRPPYGDYDASVLTDVATAGYGVLLLWSCDSRDSLGATADEIVANCG